MRRAVLIFAGVTVFAVFAVCTRDEPAKNRVGAASTTSTTHPYDGRLHHAVQSQGYSADSPAANSWRLDPAPSSQQPSLTREFVLAQLRAQPFVRSYIDEGKAVQVWFGLFSGGAPQRVEGIPSWLVVVRDITVSPSMGSPVPGYALTIVEDNEQIHALNGFEQSGGDPPMAY